MVLTILGLIFGVLVFVILTYLSCLEQEIEYQEQNSFYDNYTRKLLKREDILSNLVIVFSILAILCVFFELIIH